MGFTVAFEGKQRIRRQPSSIHPDASAAMTITLMYRNWQTLKSLGNHNNGYSLTIIVRTVIFSGFGILSVGSVIFLTMPGTLISSDESCPSICISFLVDFEKTQVVGNMLLACSEFCSLEQAALVTIMFISQVPLAAMTVFGSQLVSEGYFCASIVLNYRSRTSFVH